MYYDQELKHFGVPGMKWGIRRRTPAEKATRRQAKIDRKKERLGKRQDRLEKRIERIMLAKKRYEPEVKYLKNLGGANVLSKRMAEKAQRSAEKLYKLDKRASRNIKRFIKTNQRLSKLDPEMAKNGKTYTERLIKQGLMVGL